MMMRCKRDEKRKEIKINYEFDYDAAYFFC